MAVFSEVEVGTTVEISLPTKPLSADREEEEKTPPI